METYLVNSCEINRQRYFSAQLKDSIKISTIFDFGPLPYCFLVSFSFIFRDLRDLLQRQGKNEKQKFKAEYTSAYRKNAKLSRNVFKPKRAFVVVNLDV